MSVFNQTHNREIIQELSDTFKLNPLTDNLPKTVIPTIQPTYDVNNRVMIIKNAGLTNATTSTSFQTLNDGQKSFYIKAISLAFIKDASATTTFIGIQGTIDGVVMTLLSFPSITLTAHNGANAIHFAGKGIKLDRGTNVNIVSTTNTANFIARGEIVGYYE